MNKHLSLFVALVSILATPHTEGVSPQKRLQDKIHNAVEKFEARVRQAFAKKPASTHTSSEEFVDAKTIFLDENSDDSVVNHSTGSWMRNRGIGQKSTFMRELEGSMAPTKKEVDDAAFSKKEFSIIDRMLMEQINKAVDPTNGALIFKKRSIITWPKEGFPETDTDRLDTINAMDHMIGGLYAGRLRSNSKRISDKNGTLEAVDVMMAHVAKRTK